ncbi:transcriptional regulator [Streptosporangium jomthongense]|uniref:AraC family transcriptional regulator n=1 Tax=Marinobacter aromaticivorans TaxID=1494078 RepID=A0ABW2IWK2_9GAMM|nr:AraC family transcriptional regulator [Marinobacter aromaticivorans]GGE69306.1 transcriptional regulator [Streptosporangium jomthongense]
MPDLKPKAHIANHYLLASVRGAEQQGFDRNDLLAGAGIPPEWLNKPGQLITEKQLTRLIKSVWRATRDEFMGLSTDRCKNGTFALMADYCLGSASLGAVLRKSARVYNIACNNLNIGFDKSDSKRLVFFCLSLKDSSRDTDHMLQEFLLLMWQRFACWLVDQQIPFATTLFNYPAPPHVAEYRAMFPTELRFDETVCGFYLHEKYLQLPITRSESELEVFLKEAPAFILHRPDHDDSLRNRIRAMLARQSLQDMPNLNELAQILHMTPRSIGRRLQEEGTSLRNIKTSLRREYAIKLMSTENLTVADVSERVGFSETASFCRAFKRWTGKSPSQWSG